MGLRTPPATQIASKTFKLSSEFVIEAVLKTTNQDLYTYLACCGMDKSQNVPGDNETEKSVIRLILGRRNPDEGFDHDCLTRLCHFLVEFGTCYVSKKIGNEVEPSSMLCYIRGIQRRLSEIGFHVNLFDGPIFRDPRSGLVPALNNKFAEQQSYGAVRKSHNILTLKDIETIFDSEHCNARNAGGFRNRLIFAIGLAIGARTTELWGLRVDQFTEEQMNGKNALLYHPKVGLRDGESKNHKGWIKYVKFRPRRIPIHDITLPNGKLNIYKLLASYFAARKAAKIFHPRLFLDVNSGRSDEVEKFFKPQPIGKNTLNRIVKDVCRSSRIRGEGANKCVTTQGLRATMISLLITSDHSDAAVVLRSGQRDSNSLLSYLNLMGRNGEVPTGRGIRWSP